MIVLLIFGGPAPFARAASSHIPANDGAGACTGCTTVPVTQPDGTICDQLVCTDPNWPSCLNQTPGTRICTPGSTSQTTTCASAGVQTCTYTCNAAGTVWENPSCVNVGNGGNFQQTFCDFGAGCPEGPNGQLVGKPTTVSQQCTQNGVIQTVTTGACGEGGCVRQPVCQPGKPCLQCKPGDKSPECNYCAPGSTRQCGDQTQVCPDSGQFPPCVQCQPGDQFTCPDGRVSQCVNGQYEVCTQCNPDSPVYCSGGGVLQCTPDGRVPECPGGCAVTGSCPQVCDRLPECHLAGSRWVCTWNGVEVVGVPTPCPQVRREPWPRGLVGVPMRFEIAGTGNVPGASNSVSIDPPTCDSRTIIGYRATLTWMVESLDDARWTMDERPWNVGRSSDDILSPVDGRPVSQSMLNGELTIRNERTGRAVTHIYETSSYDKPQNGPGWPDLAQRQPAYQVQLKTRWTLVGNFQYQQRETIEVCKDNSNPPATVPCPPPQEWCDQHPGDSSCRGDIHIRVTEIISPWHPGPVIRVPNVEIEGAVTPQDTAKAQTCDAIAVSVIQSQVILRP